ncbi:MAG TPA: glycosyl hydrolase family 28 protein, partial [Candidatus Limnocylindria bacterium]|nr:glycosyl hydrolase family 28 protein [Candidatus Limnocylindria bacterium]
VIDSPISEDAMVGSAVGAAIQGMRPIIEMQFAHFSTVGFNQIVNQAATLFWRTQVPCPIVVRLLRRHFGRRAVSQPDAGNDLRALSRPRGDDAGNGGGCLQHVDRSRAMNVAVWWKFCPIAQALMLLCVALASLADAAVFNVKDYGATGQKADDARPAIQKTIEACAAAGGGTVLVPPGEYTSGTLHLRSHVRFEIAAGATLFGSTNLTTYEFEKIPSKAALFFGEDLEDVTITGGGIVDGQAEYEWREDDMQEVFDHKTQMQKLGKSLRRSFPIGLPKREVFPHLVWLGRSKDVKINGLKFLHSQSWTIALYACERARFDSLYIYTSLQDGVWADGIDLDGCKDVVISNCTIETGDDCIIFISSDSWGPALPCENITVTNCRLSSASAGVKFSEGNRVGVRNVRVIDSVLTNVNRGFVFSTTLGGDISDVVLSNLTIHCNRFDWFWAGDGQPFHFRITRLSEFNKVPAKPGEPPPGAIRNITIRDVTAHAKGSSRLHGHTESWLDGIRLENVKLFVSSDPAAPFDVAEHALDFRRAKNIKIKAVEVFWKKPALQAWKSALYFEEIHGLDLDGFSGNSAWPERDVPATVLHEVTQAIVRNAWAVESTAILLKIIGQKSREIRIHRNQFRGAKVPYQIDASVPAGAVEILEKSFPD